MDTLKKCARHLPALLGVALLFGAIYVVQKEFRSLKLADISRALGAISSWSLAFSFFWTVMSYYVLTFYDLLGTIYAGHRVAYGRVCFASFCAYTLSHNLGFAAVSGAAVRYRLYAHWGLTPMQIAKLVAFCSLTFALGGMVLGGVVVFAAPDAVPLLGAMLPRWMLYLAGLGLWGVVIGYVTLSRIIGSIRLFGHAIELPGFRLALVQVVLATIDVVITAVIFYALLPTAPGLTLLSFLAVYVASYTAGLAANLPGGIGVFDTVMLIGLSPWLDAPSIIGAIVVFRLYYYIIPLFVAGSMFAGNELLLRGGSMFKGVQTIARWIEPDFPIAVATGAVALCGALLLSVGVLAPPPDFTWIDPDFADLASQAGEFVPSLIGAGLMVLAIGISRRVNLAWGATLALLLIGAVFIFVQGEWLWVGVVLLVAMLLIAPFRRGFYRHAHLFTGPPQVSMALPLLGLAACVLVLAGFAHRTPAMSEHAWWEIIFSPDMPASLRVAVALAVALGLYAIWSLIRPGLVTAQPWDAASRDRFAGLGGIPPAQADGLIWGESKRAAIPFRRCGRILLGLGDPIGDPTDRIAAIWRLRDFAAQEGSDAAFWRAGPDLLGVYGDLGLTALPLGADNQPLPEAAEDTPMAEHYLVCVAERDLTTLLPMLPELAAQAA
jgi:uncharacterized membrane protein YbhN (UPF0104 family)